MGALTSSLMPQPLTPEVATARINAVASRGFTLVWDEDVPSKLREKELIIGDLHYVLRVGKVSLPGMACSTALTFKYIVETKTPNWIGKNLRIMAILGNTDEIRVCDVLD
ncbi:hypothetical protein FHW79_001679 [Azospirillum sp. OGB3]|uniref:hypothetical protein n=1 Tax=Azospirillum sp. OGB3 TaxID=2587012 RepID=UPI001606A7C9|nr:hypothetical protein [Azospirillum sp. OGB3]MBB3264064.1 hypothetical protein [Azospirillum sp. OGB3]